jgi:hypothetical protein
MSEDLEQLKNTNRKQYDILKACFQLDTCKDFGMYKTEKFSVDKRVKKVASLFRASDKELSYFDAIELLYQVM